MTLLGLAIAAASHERTERQAAADHTLTSRAADQAAAIDAYFERARATIC
jgi:hypothetical protein